jgi:hypothetical protein
MNTKHDAACRLMKYPADPGRNWLDESTTHKICPKKARSLIMFRIIQRRHVFGIIQTKTLLCAAPRFLV